jgi:predicted ATPase
VAQTDGVPLFIEELTKAVLERASQPDSAGSALSVPSTLQASLMARLDRLPVAKQVAQIGAVVGREFSNELLAAVAGIPEAALTQGLDDLVSAGLAFRRGTPPEAIYSFKHALVQDAAYGSLLRSTRQKFHSRIARVLEERWPDVVETQPELLAHHFTQAGSIEHAADYWQRAGERAFRRSAAAEATGHLAKSIEPCRKTALKRSVSCISRRCSGRRASPATATPRRKPPPLSPAPEIWSSPSATCHNNSPCCMASGLSNMSGWRFESSKTSPDIFSPWPSSTPTRSDCA